MPKENWRKHGVPFTDFNQELTQEWILQGFTKNQCQDWLGIGLNATDTYYCAWLRDIKQKDSEWVLNYGHANKLRKEYHEWMIKELKNLNVPTHTPGAFIGKTPWIILLIAVIALYLLTK